MHSSTFRVGGRNTWLGIVALVAAVGIVEIGAVAFLGHTFLPASLAWTLDAVGVLLLAVSAFAIASVTWRRHRVTDTETLLVLGYLGQIRVPLTAITSVTEAPPLAGVEADRTGPTLTDSRLNLVAATGVPRVVVSLGSGQVGRRLWQRRPVTQVDVSDATGRLAATLLASRQED